MLYIKNDINKKEIILNLLKENKVEAILLYNPINRSWFSEFNSSEGYILITTKKSILYVDSRYITDAKKNAKNIDEIIEFGNVFDLIKIYLKEYKINKLAFESDFLSFDHYKLLQDSLTSILVVPIDTSKIRKVKTNSEIELIHKACKISDNTFTKILQNIKPGISELELDKIIFSSFMDEGASGFSFSTIVASGKRGALPHGRASKKLLANNELVTIDFGCYYKNYSSDITRTVAIGNPNPKLLEIYDIVKTAQQMGINAVKPGIRANEIDKICRDYITEKGYGEYFKHSTGHGLGANVHEFPRISLYCDAKLEPGMVITVEPGIYIPELGGVRIEDDILVTDNGYKMLTNSPRELIKIKEKL